MFIFWYVSVLCVSWFLRRMCYVMLLLWFSCSCVVCYYVQLSLPCFTRVPLFSVVLSVLVLLYVQLLVSLFVGVSCIVFSVFVFGCSCLCHRSCVVSCVCYVCVLMSFSVLFM